MTAEKVMVTLTEQQLKNIKAFGSGYSVTVPLFQLIFEDAPVGFVNYSDTVSEISWAMDDWSDIEDSTPLYTHPKELPDDASLINILVAIGNDNYDHKDISDLRHKLKQYGIGVDE